MHGDMKKTRHSHRMAEKNSENPQTGRPHKLESRCPVTSDVNTTNSQLMSSPTSQNTSTVRYM